jgi:hypothetical protein
MIAAGNEKVEPRRDDIRRAFVLRDPTFEKV